jgi:hypothetical protein
MSTFPFQLSEDEKRLVREGECLEQMTALPGWKFVLEFLERKVEEAHEESMADKLPSPLKAQSLLMREQQRRVMVNSLRSYVEDAIKAKHDFVHTLTTSGEEENEYSEHSTQQ